VFPQADELDGSVGAGGSTDVGPVAHGSGCYDWNIFRAQAGPRAVTSLPPASRSTAQKVIERRTRRQPEGLDLGHERVEAPEIANFRCGWRDQDSRSTQFQDCK
jgi:hypothetical protein